MAIVLGEQFSYAYPIGVTGLTFTRDASYIEGSAVTWNPTITEVGTTGTYLFTYTATVAGSHVWVATSSGGHDVTINFDVIPAAADPAALATAIAAVQATVDTIDGNVDVAVSTRATPGSYITTRSATATSGAATVYQGDDQVEVASRSLDWATITADQWPDLTGATILLSGQYRANAAHTVSAAGLVITPTGATKHVRVELSAAQTEALHDGVYEIQVIATTTTGKVVTLVDTTMTVKPRKGA